MNAGTSGWYEFKRGDGNLLKTLRPSSWHTSKTNKGHLGLQKTASLRQQRYDQKSMNGLRPGNVCNFDVRTLCRNALWATPLSGWHLKTDSNASPFSNPQIMQGTGLETRRFSYVNCSLSYGRTHQRATNLRVVHTQSIARTLWFEVGYPAFTFTIPTMGFSLKALH